MIEAIILIYIGGVLALFMESVIQWLHPEESGVKESLLEALKTALAWPLMAFVALAELTGGKDNGKGY